MLNLKIIILLIGVFLMTLGYVNNVKDQPQQKNIYQPFPRNVYDEIFFSLPLLDFDDNLNKKVNPVYVLEDASDYRTLFQKDVNMDTDENYVSNKSIYQDLDDMNYFNQELGIYNINK